MEIQEYMANSYGWIGLNFRDERLAEKNVRQALTYGFDRAGFMDHYYDGNGYAISAPFSPVAWAYTEENDAYPYDPAKAIELLEEAGWMPGADGIREKDGKRLDFIWDTYTDSKYMDTLIPIVKAQWKEIGVNVEHNLQDFSSLIDKVFTEQDFEMCNMSWSLTIDPGSVWTTYGTPYSQPGGNNAGAYSNPEADELMEAGLKEIDQEKRTEIYHEIGRIIKDDCPYVFIGGSYQWDVANERVKNFTPNSFQSWTHFIQDMEIESN